MISALLHENKAVLLGITTIAPTVVSLLFPSLFAILLPVTVSSTFAIIVSLLFSQWYRHHDHPIFLFLVASGPPFIFFPLSQTQASSNSCHRKIVLSSNISPMFV